jgi:hypothetical protein
MGTTGPISKKIQQILEIHFGIRLDAESLKEWERFIGQASYAFQA